MKNSYASPHTCEVKCFVSKLYKLHAFLNLIRKGRHDLFIGPPRCMCICFNTHLCSYWGIYITLVDVNNILKLIVCSPDFVLANIQNIRGKTKEY